MSSCCQDKSCEVETLRRSQSNTLWIVLGINALMFGGEVVVGLLAGSVALLADSLDMLGDTLVYGFSLFVVGRSARWRAGAALLKGGIMMLFGAGVLAQIAYKLVSGAVPDAHLIGIMGVVALAANVTCLVLLTRHKADDINMRSTWVCSRNDIIANAGVILSAAGVFLMNSVWPDLVIGVIIAAVFVRSAVRVLRNALDELGVHKQSMSQCPFSGRPPNVVSF